MKSIQKKMKELRLENKMTQEELAEKMHLSKNSISNYENGLRMMDAEKIKRMCEIFGVDILEKRKVATNGPIIVSSKDIAANGFNLSASYYKDKQPVTMVFDIEYGLERQLLEIAEREDKSLEEVMIEALKIHVGKN